MNNLKVIKRDRRHVKIRAKISGTSDCPRLSIFKSNRYLYAQLINDDTQTTILSVSTLPSKVKKVTGAKNTLASAKAIGTEVAKLALAAKIKRVVFDRGGFIYTGKVKAIADGAREGGLTF